MDEVPVVETECPLAASRAECTWAPYGHDCATVNGGNPAVPVENSRSGPAPEPDPMPLSGPA